jgi:hypothetical protein
MNADSISLEQIQQNKNFNSKSFFTEDENNPYNNLSHNCEYFDVNEFRNKVGFLSNQFSSLSFNIRSLPNKFEAFTHLLTDLNHSSFKFSVLGLQELWSVPFTMSIPGYSKLEYKVRESSKNNAGGGVGLFIDENYEYEILDQFSVFIPNLFESIFVKIKLEKNKFTIVGNLYRPNCGPQAKVSRFNEILSDLLYNIQNDPLLKKADGITLLGDYNINLLQHLNHSDTANYLDLLFDNDFLPLIVLPTRVSHTSASVIDHISTNIKDTVFDTGIILNDISDHFPVFYIRHMRIAKEQKPKIKTRLINKETISSFKTSFDGYDWLNVIQEQDPVKSFSNFFETFSQNFDQCFPEVEKKQNKRTIPINPWFTEGLLISRKNKEKLFKIKLKIPSHFNNEKFKHFNDMYVKLCRTAKMTYYKNQFNEHKSDIRKTWSTINQVLGRERNKESLPSFFISNQNILSDTFEIAEGFNNFFSNIGPELAANIPPSNKHFSDYLSPAIEENFIFANVTKEIVLENIRKLKTKNSAGPDDVSTKLLKDIIELIADPLAHLFNLSFKTGYIPIELKTAKVIPIYKDGDKHCFGNYRPISLLSNFAKLLEKIAASQMVKYLNKFNIFYEHQYGFRKGHNTVHPVLHFLDKIYKGFNKNTPDYILTIFIDLKKAFDTCDFDILLKKLSHYGFRGVSNTWFKNYLTNRLQFTSINGVNSSPSTMLTGVPQGSVLGPLLFLILINDLCNASSKLFTLLFADDTTLQFSSNDLNILYNTVNIELEKAAEWFKANKLTLNISKTKYMLFRQPSQMIDFNNYNIKMDDKTIERIGEDCKTKFFKFVGIKLDEHLTWSHHLNHVRGKLSSANYALSRIKNLLPTNIKLDIYNALFKSHLEYGLICWGGAKSSKLKPLLILQKKCIRHIAGDHTLANYSNPLIYLKLKISLQTK